MSAQMTPTEVAKAAGWPRPNRLFNFLSGRSASLSQETLEALTRVIPGSTMAALSGVEPVDHIAPLARPIVVRAVAQAGLMQSGFELPLGRQSTIQATVAEDMHARGIFGVEVRAPGAERLYADGSILLCIPISAYESDLVSGKKVILQRIRGAQVEVTVREIQIEASEAWLWMRSTHPEHQAPIPMPWTPGRQPAGWRDDQDRYSIAAVVVLAIIPQ
jgi:hypothetical protein